MIISDILSKAAKNKKFGKFRRKTVVFRSFMARAWSWVNVPSFVLILVGVMKPYIQPYFDISVIWLAVFTALGLLILGYLERYLGFFREESSYSTEQNALLLNRLDDLENKLDEVINVNKQRDHNKDSVQDSEHKPSIRSYEVGNVPVKESEGIEGRDNFDRGTYVGDVLP